jgi:hypothetical protein
VRNPYGYGGGGFATSYYVTCRAALKNSPIREARKLLKSFNYVNILLKALI